MIDPRPALVLGALAVGLVVASTLAPRSPPLAHLAAHANPSSATRFPEVRAARCSALYSTEAPFVQSPTGADARFMLPTDVAVLPGDVILVADLGNNAIRQVTLGGAVTTYAAGLTSPQGLAVAPDGTLYITEPDAGTIRHHDGVTLTLVAGSGAPGYADDPDPLAGQLHGLEGLDVSADGQYLYVANGTRGEDLPYHFVRRVTLD